MVAKEFDEVSKVGVAIFKKPANNSAYESREVAEPEICAEDNKADAAWWVLVFLYDDVRVIVRLFWLLTKLIQIWSAQMTKSGCSRSIN